MTRYIRRLSKAVDMEHYQLHIRVISLHIQQSSTLFPKEGDRSLMGVYFKMKRGNNRINGKNRYAVYSSPEGTTLIDETFE
jgi:hypothetical protein